jgi:CyaY protein
MSQPLTEQEFDRAADQALRALDKALNEIAEIDADLESGILSVEFTDGAKYVVNSHRAARQIWMAAERTAWHFDLRADDGAWIAAKTGDELWKTLERVLSEKLKRPVALAR